MGFELEAKRRKKNPACVLSSQPASKGTSELGWRCCLSIFVKIGPVVSEIALVIFQCFSSDLLSDFMVIF